MRVARTVREAVHLKGTMKHNTDDPIHPQSREILRQLVSLHGAHQVLAAVRQIAQDNKEEEKRRSQKSNLTYIPS